MYFIIDFVSEFHYSWIFGNLSIELILIALLNDGGYTISLSQTDGRPPHLQGENRFRPDGSRNH